MKDDAWSIWRRGGKYADFVEGTVVPKSFLPAIGFVNVAFSRLDVQIDRTIAHLMKLEPATGRALASAAPNYRPRIELLDRLIDIYVDSELDRRKLHKVTTDIMALADKRHRLVHDYVASLSWFDQKLSFVRRESIFKSTKPTNVTKQSLKSLGQQMIDLAYRLQRFTKDDPRWRSAGRFPWPGKPSQ